MWSHLKMLRSVNKVIAVIDSIHEHRHLKACERLIANFGHCYSCGKRSNRILAKSYEQFLTKRLQNRICKVIEQ